MKGFDNETKAFTNKTHDLPAKVELLWTLTNKQCSINFPKLRIDQHTYSTQQSSTNQNVEVNQQKYEIPTAKNYMLSIYIYISWIKPCTSTNLHKFHPVAPALECDFLNVFFRCGWWQRSTENSSYNTEFGTKSSVIRNLTFNILWMEKSCTSCGNYETS